MKRKDRKTILIHNPFLFLILEKLLSHGFILLPEFLESGVPTQTIALNGDWPELGVAAGVTGVGHRSRSQSLP